MKLKGCTNASLMMQRSSDRRRGITILELLVVLVIIGILFVLLAPALIRPHDGSIRMRCMSNQKQVALANLMWMSDNMDRFPWQIPVAEEGSLEYTNQALPHFQILSNYMRAPMVFACPTDGARVPTNTYATLSRTNLSYFLNLDAGTNLPVTTFLSGDRHLALSNLPVRSGAFLLRNDQVVSWTSELHKDRRKIGLVSFCDGHVEVITADQLKNAIARQPLGTNRLVVP